MFQPLIPVVTWIFDQVSALLNLVWTQGSWLGVGLICLPLIARVIHIFKKLF